MVKKLGCYDVASKMRDLRDGGWAAFEYFEVQNRARALDYVNGAGRFFTLWTDGLTQYINKSLVRMIRPLD